MQWRLQVTRFLLVRSVVVLALTLLWGCGRTVPIGQRPTSIPFVAVRPRATKSESGAWYQDVRTYPFPSGATAVQEDTRRLGEVGIDAYQTYWSGEYVLRVREDQVPAANQVLR